MAAGVAVWSLLFPWWMAIIWIVSVAFFIKTTTRVAILSGAVALGVVWLLMSIILLLNDHMQIIGKSAQLLGGLSDYLLIIISLVIALITGGLSGWFGHSLGIVFRKSK